MAIIPLHSGSHVIWVPYSIRKIVSATNPVVGWVVVSTIAKNTAHFEGQVSTIDNIL